MLLVGPSGSGKTTLARAIAGLIPREFPGEWRGSLRVGGFEVSKASPADLSARVGIVFQDPASQIVMEGVGDDVAFGLENRAWPLEAMLSRVPAALSEVGLAGFDDRQAQLLSGGEQQRLALAGTLAPGPGVLVLDEPTATLDPSGTAAVFERVAALRAAGTTIVLVEHRVEWAWPNADIVLALAADASPIDLGPPAELLARSGERLAREGIWLPEARSRPGPADAAPDIGGAAARRGPAVPKPVSASEILRLNAVRFAYSSDRPVLDGIDLAIAPAERTALVGANGSGKTTALRLALGLLRPSAGQVWLAGSDPARLRSRAIAGIAGYVVQDPELGFIANSVREEVFLGLDATGQARAGDLAARLNLPLETFAERSPYRLSGGEQRRLSLVSALARQPRLLALDEPTFGQDRNGHEALVRALDELVDDGTAVLAATHDERFVRDALTRRISLGGGRVDGDDPVSQGEWPGSQGDLAGSRGEWAPAEIRR